MSDMPHSPRNVAAFLMASVFVVSATADPALLAPKFLLTDQSVTRKDAQAISLAARTYYTFWDTGDPRYAQKVLSYDFVDLNLPDGRPQGPEGPIMASKQFRQAIPDLSVSVEEMFIVGDRAIGRLRFRGHFTGKFNGVTGTGQAIDFAAVDIYQIKEGMITSNWHMEDNLTLLQQMGIVER